MTINEKVLRFIVLVKDTIMYMNTKFAGTLVFWISMYVIKLVV